MKPMPYANNQYRITILYLDETGKITDTVYEYFDHAQTALDVIHGINTNLAKYYRIKAMPGAMLVDGDVG